MFLLSLALNVALMGESASDGHASGGHAPIGHVAAAKPPKASKSSAKPSKVEIAPPVANLRIINENENIVLLNRPKLSADKQQAILQSDLKKLETLLLGTYSNEAQVFFAPDLGTKAPAQLAISVEKLKNSQPDQSILNIQYRHVDSGKILRNRIWHLGVDNAKFAIIAKQFELNPLDKNDVNALMGCEIEFHRRGTGFSGQLQNNCILNVQSGQIKAFEKHEIDTKTWEISDFAQDFSGRQIYSNLDNFPSIYRKANPFVCWASNASSTQSNLKTHDQGGEVRADFGGKSIRFKLRAVEWPYGNNRPSLTLYLFTNNEDYAQFYTWSELDSQRIALSYGEYQISCTKE
jgi:CpeT/CpcT family (DUF1001)